MSLRHICCTRFDSYNVSRYEMGISDNRWCSIRKRQNRNRFATRWKHLSGKFYPLLLSHQARLLLITIVCIDGSRTCLAVFWFVRRCEKMARWMVRSKGVRFLLAWYSQIARKMEKIYNKRWNMCCLSVATMQFCFGDDASTGTQFGLL